MKRLFHILVKKAALKIGVIIQRNSLEIGRRTLPRFGNNPKNLTIELPRRIINSERIYLGDNVHLGPGSFLIALTHYPPQVMQNPERPIPVQLFDSKIVIGNRVTATADLQVSAQSEIIIEDDVMFSSNIHVNDGFHGYDTTESAFNYQKIGHIYPILIKRGCWIGQNVVITPGVTIG